MASTITPPSNFKTLRRLLRKSGWYLARTRKHEVWRCSCGEHQTTIGISVSDTRAIKNKVAELRRYECPTLEGVL